MRSLCAFGICHQCTQCKPAALDTPRALYYAEISVPGAFYTTALSLYSYSVYFFGFFWISLIRLKRIFTG